MPKFKSREELYDAYSTTKKSDWYKWIMSLTVDSTIFKKPIYHLSGKDDLSGTWTPRDRNNLSKTFSDTEEQKRFNMPKGSQLIFDEPLPPRISGGLDYNHCYYGIYPTLWTYIYEEDIESFNEMQEFEAFIYQIDYSNCKIILPDTLVSEYLVHDAHMSEEVVIFGKPRVTLKKEVSLIHPGKNAKPIYYKPFNDSKYDEILLAYEMVIKG